MKIKEIHTKNRIFVFCIMLLTIVLLYSFIPKKSPAEIVKASQLIGIKAFQLQLDSFQMIVKSNKNKTHTISQFKKVRLSFKNIEFLLEYIYPRIYPFFNGANAIEMDDGYNPNIKPEGLQVIETELFKDSLDTKRILFLITQLKYRTLSYYQFLQSVDLKDIYIFDAIRYHLIRIETLNLVSFDSPIIRNNTAEISVSLKSILDIIEKYKPGNASVEYFNLKSTFHYAIEYLANKKFNNLDRIYFVKNILHRLKKNLNAFQSINKIQNLFESNLLYKPVDLYTSTIYDADFINPTFFAQDRYYLDNPLIAEIGKKLFFDKRLSAENKLSCATCHQPANAFTDKEFTAITNIDGVFQKRNTPTLLNAALQAGFFYDTRAITLEQQIGHVITNPQEFNSTYDTVINRLKNDTQYVRMFTQAFPSYQNELISTYTINTCIADFQRKLILLNSPFDKYMRNETNYLSESTKRGFNLFIGKAQCGSCHFAPTFFGLAPPFYTNSESEVIGVTKKFDTLHPVLDDDIGRFKNLEIDDFKHSFKTSTVRNSFLTAPYFHNGGFLTLPDVLEFYNQGGAVGLGLELPNQTLSEKKLQLTNQDKKDIISFIKSLTDTSGVAKICSVPR